jgi:ATP phosphoribosyltransferase
MSAALVIAVPSKGRLQENTAAFFERAGIPLSQDGSVRNYRGTIRGLPGVEVLFLSASEIVAKLASGDAHFGVTGEDLVREAVVQPDSKVVLLTPLGFGHADVVVAVPKGWIDARTMEDIEEIAADFHLRHGRRMRVATKYIQLTRRFFASHSVTDYRIVESLGATEGAPAAGTAEFIVDITTTGSTLEANALKVLDDGVILKSQANLVASLGADWSAQARQAARTVLGRISAEQSARTRRQVHAAVPGSQVDAVRAAALAAGAVPTSAGGDDVAVLAPLELASAVSDAMLAAGASQVRVSSLDYVFSPVSPLLDRLLSALDAKQAGA